jgi:hypothetical protein
MRPMKFDEAVDNLLNKEQNLDWYKGWVKERAGENPTIEDMKRTLEEAWMGAGHSRFKHETLHRELLLSRGKGNKKRKFVKAGYYPEGDRFDPQYMKDWLQREILGEFMIKRDGPMPFNTPR